MCAVNMCYYRKFDASALTLLDFLPYASFLGHVGNAVCMLCFWQATDIAETSITINGILYVVDSGRVKVG